MENYTVIEESRDQTNLQTSLHAKNDSKVAALKAESADDFAIRYMFDQIFFEETRIFLSSNRGPYLCNDSKLPLRSS